MSKINRKILIIINAALLIISAACCIGIYKNSRTFLNPKEYERWRGDRDIEFTQLSMFIPSSDNISTAEINAYRTSMQEAFKKENIIEDTSDKIFVDCWSLNSSCNIVTDKAHTEASVIAVGGEFFDFHPITLLSGQYISEDDYLNDWVILDEELAWYLFGSSDVVGLSVNIDAQTFYIAGVIDREDDKASTTAYSGGMGLYMPYDAYKYIHENDAPVTCYEVVMPDPVKNYALNLAKEKFPSKKCEIIVNKDRFKASNLITVTKNLPSRAMNSSVPYPYWENAIRYSENISAVLLIFAVLALIFPLITLIWLLIKGIKAGRSKLGENIIPDLKDNIEESIRVRQRARWEKKHPGQK